jgi:hypothetical protein
MSLTKDKSTCTLSTGANFRLLIYLYTYVSITDIIANSFREKHTIIR